MNPPETTTAASSDKEGAAVRVCSKCQIHPRASRGSWCQPCRREAQRAYNTRTRSRPEVRTATCAVCNTGMEWLSGHGPDRVYCSTKCKRLADQATQTERRQAQRDPAHVAAEVERTALYNQGYRRCNACAEVKELGDYHRRGQGWQHRCIECSTQLGRDATAQMKRRSWRSHLKVRFNLTETEWDAMLIAQQGRCYLCADPMTEPAVDHDHGCCGGRRTCGECLRGLACGRCNVGIGAFDDDPDRMLTVAVALASRKAEMRP